MNIYESDKLLAEYLLFHYGRADEVLPARSGLGDALGYPARCVSEGLDLRKSGVRALDLGCAVGRSSFELARHFRDVIGIDFSQRFIDAASHLREIGSLAFSRIDEGALTTPCVAEVPADIDRSRVRFEVGDAMNLRTDLGRFDVVLLANLIDRLAEPARCLAHLPTLVVPGGQLIITSPYTWLEEFTPRENWLGGYARERGSVSTREGLHAMLKADFTLLAAKDLPFLIREHARKFQFSIAEATIWRRHD